MSKAPRISKHSCYTLYENEIGWEKLAKPAILTERVSLVPMQRIGIFWIPDSLLKESWLISRRTSALFFLSAILVLGLTPVFMGQVDTTNMSFWHRVPWGLLGVLGPVGLFFLWFGMWRYWIRLDRSTPWLKRTWFLVLLLGFWWGSVLYYFAVYVPQVLSKQKTEG